MYGEGFKQLIGIKKMSSSVCVELTEEEQMQSNLLI